MRRSVVVSLALLLVAPLLLAFVPAARPANVVALGGEVLVAVASRFDRYLYEPTLATLPGRGFVLAWADSYASYSGSQLIGWGAGISSRTLNPQGAPAGGELPLVPEETHAYMGSPDLAADGSGRLALVWWARDGTERGSTSETFVRLRRFAGGRPAGPIVELDVLRHLSYVRGTAVAVDPLGRLLAAWEENDQLSPLMRVFARFLGPSDRPLGGRFIASTRPGAHGYPDVAMDGSGRSVLVFHHESGGGAAQVRFRLFDRQGRPRGGELRVGATAGPQLHPAVAANAAGRFVVAWSGRGTVHGQLFAPSGEALGPPFQVAPPAGATLQGFPEVAVDRSGRFVVVWTRVVDTAADLHYLARAFDPAGRPFGAPFRVDPPAADGGGQGTDSGMAVAMADSGRFVVAWQARPEFGSREVRARTFAIVAPDAACGYEGGAFVCGVGEEVEVRFGGEPGDVPFLADVDGDGADDPCLRRGNAFHCDARHDGGAPDRVFLFGVAGHVPLMGDLDGDARDDPCVRRGATFLCDSARDGGTAEERLRFGLPEDAPLLGDADGDGDDDPCLWRAGASRFFCDLDRDGAADVAHLLSEAQAGARPLLGDCDADGRDEFCLAMGGVLACDVDRDGLLEVPPPFALPAGLALLGHLAPPAAP